MRNRGLTDFIFLFFVGVNGASFVNECTEID